MHNLSIFSALNRVVFAFKDSEIFASDACYILVSFLNEKYPGRAGFVEVANPSVSVVFCLSDVAKVTEPVVAPSPIGVIYVVRPFAINKQPYNPMSLGVFPVNSDIYIPGISRDIPCCHSRVFSVPSQPRLSARKMTPVSDHPGQAPGVGAVVKAFFQILLSYNHDIASQAIRSFDLMRLLAANTRAGFAAPQAQINYSMAGST